MTRYAPLWQQNNSYPAQIDRGLISTIWPTSRSTGAVPSIGTNTMNVLITAGTAIVALQTGQQSALCRWDAAEVVTLAAAPASGQTRRDLIVLQVRDQAIDAGANSDFIFQPITGTPTTGVPVTPAAPANSYPLYYVTVTGGSANLNGAVITDMRVNTLRPMTPPVYTGAEINGVASMTDDTGEVWVCKAGVNGGAWRRARDVLHARVYRAGALVIGAPEATFPFDSVGRDPYGLWVPAQTQFVVPIAGLWLVHSALMGAGSGLAQAFYSYLYAEGVTPGTASNHSSTVTFAFGPVNVATIEPAAGTSVRLTAGTSGGNLAMNVGPTFTYMNLDYLGTG